MFDYLSLEYQSCVRFKTLRRFCEGSASDVAWLGAQGVHFSGDAVTGNEMGWLLRFQMASQ